MSENFDQVKGFYNVRLWSENMVWNVIDRWITADEFMEITGKKYENKKA